jgi:hypothetical protein
MRQIFATALVAVIVGALAGATAGAVAQGEPTLSKERAISPSAVSSINAHRVDGKHAVGYGVSKAKRAYKLVATNASGVLPSNIVKTYWGSIKNKPAGFADGVDNKGLSGVYWKDQSWEFTGSQRGATLACDSGHVAIGGSAWTYDVDQVAIQESRPDDDEGTSPYPTRWLATFKMINGTGPARVYVSVICARR